jgi:hypothetical protein
MKPSFLNELSSSFCLFVDHEIAFHGEGFENIISGSLYPSYDPNFDSKVIYQSPYRQWVSDESIVGVGSFLPVTVNSGSTPISKGQYGLNIDYGMGRVFFDKTGTSADSDQFNVSYSRKEFNIFMTSLDETSLLLNDTEYYSIFETGVPVDVEPYPLIYIKHFYSESRPFAFGGLDESDYEFRCLILSDDLFKLDSVISILQDSSKKSFSVIPSSGLPFNLYGDFKKDTYNYFEFCENFSENLAYIDSVNVSKFDEKTNKLIKGAGVYGGFADFKIKSVRNPRISL